jgi:hypothetical protein
MKIWMAVLVTGCWGSSPPPTAAPAPRELRCKTAVEQASAAIDLRDKDITMAIGECEQREWSQKARTCVAAARTKDALSACGTSYALGTHGIFGNTLGAEAALKKMGEFRDEMCACSDTACVQKASDEMARWSQEQARDNEDPPPRMSDEQMKRATAIGEEMGKCMQRAMGAAP